MCVTSILRIFTHPHVQKNEYKAYSKAARAERRAQLKREKERQRRLKEGYNDTGSSEYTDSDDDSDEERRRRLEKANSESK